MKTVIFFALVFRSISVFPQTPQEEINNQVWKPFISTFNAGDTKGFMEVHSKDVVRSPRDAKIVLNWNDYFQQQKRGDQNKISSASKRVLELRFTERLADKDLAIEVGIYKTTSQRNDDLSQSFYGRFHVVLRKENDVWKILVDTDSSEGGSINEKDFLEGQPME